MMGLGPGRFRPGPQSETEKTPAFALEFLLLWACQGTPPTYRRLLVETGLYYEN